MSRLAITPMLRRHDARGLIASHKNLVVSVHWGQTMLEHVDALAQLTEEVTALHARFATAVVVFGGDVLHAPDSETRARLTQLVKDTEHTGLGTAFVVHRGGFLGSAVVSLLSGLFVLSRSPEPNRAFRTTEAAAPWLQEQLANGTPSWHPSEVHETLKAVVALHPPAT